MRAPSFSALPWSSSASLPTVLAGFAHWLTLRRLRRGQEVLLPPWSLSITVAVLLAVIGLVSLWHLLER